MLLTMDGLPDTVIAALPLPVCHVGYVFLAYSSDEQGPAYFCECATGAVQNCITNAAEERRRLLEAGRGAVHDGVLWRNCSLFPRAVRREMEEAHFDDALFALLRFRPGLCHRCQRAVPPHRHYCDHSYFENVFGRLIRHDLYHLGFDWVARPLPFVRTKTQTELMPADFEAIAARRELLAGVPYSYWKPNSEALKAVGLSSNAELHHERQQVEEKYRSAVGRVRDHVVAGLRRHYDFPTAKRGLQRETILYYNVRAIFRTHSVVRHARPSFLKGLELDIWIPELRVAIEFQGEQHETAVEHWGGTAALRGLQERDRRKKKRCEKEGITLICFDADADLNEPAVAARLRSVMPTSSVRHG